MNKLLQQAAKAAQFRSKLGSTQRFFSSNKFSSTNGINVWPFASAAVVGSFTLAVFSSTVFADNNDKKSSEGSFFDGIKGFFSDIAQSIDPPKGFLLPPPVAQDASGKPGRTLVLDFEGTLVHMDFEGSGFSRGSMWRIAKRPGVAEFLQRCQALGYEIVIFCDQYSSPLLDQAIMGLDTVPRMSHVLYKDHGAMHWGKAKFVKDLSRLGRDMRRVIAIDDSAEVLGEHVTNAIVVPTFVGDPQDRVLKQLIPVLEAIQNDDVDDVREVLRAGNNTADLIIKNHEQRQKEIADLMKEMKKDERSLPKLGIMRQQPTEGGAKRFASKNKFE